MRRKIIIARHGNTFRPGETPTRVGAKTDLPLVEEHRARSIGIYLKENNLIPDTVYAAPLLRTKQTAELAVQVMGLQTSVIPLVDFVEIDYGVDENRTEEEVMMRLGAGDIAKGKAIIDAWNKEAIVPDGWHVNPQQIIRTWEDFAAKVASDPAHQTVLLVSSNGILRFAPYLTGDFEKFTQEHEIKVATGGVCVFEKEDNEPFWTCTAWDVKPYKLYPAS
ncbi:broad specificity phosphatase PhoE [Parabacteroides sp. PF5-5]|uniref:histidine phosphatase family protein n=1 Tax=unclassified Parabacteroides TaxID=2649774 RepID=UPI002474278C|nr:MULTISPECIES: histidine phosphatase family protein [unclassified Parabacteroides]MDH6306434.1 broad specificity phosphatase PhoE [Parabacteroides sp. PH5-39]MDH6317414.1 broad specificity phosphatase PhoE [Parabacteroides sp. PF5-13]MDH6321145.1 broad specificity phosphatase PhoE [Parabacteroides sp. PH5-13]MDH6324877.1 broad specificity phosphatase PhoE [Parabacteroides sp. PH5-8]MDH6328599.1 broad specificity phosphatase PhoE [Parabacteroides sp. PH5-41]